MSKFRLAVVQDGCHVNTVVEGEGNRGDFASAFAWGASLFAGDVSLWSIDELDTDYAKDELGDKLIEEIREALKP